jgi:hypothetical protein
MRALRSLVKLEISIERTGFWFHAVSEFHPLFEGEDNVGRDYQIVELNTTPTSRFAIKLGSSNDSNLLSSKEARVRCAWFGKRFYAQFDECGDYRNLERSSYLP